MRAAIACIGAACVDRKAQALQSVALASSNPVRVTVGFGGVARNVAANLALLRCDVALVSRVGRDGHGDRLVEDLNSLGVVTGAICRSRSS